MADEEERPLLNLKTYERFHAAVMRVGARRGLTQADVLEQYALPALWKEYVQVVREEAAELGVVDAEDAPVMVNDIDAGD
jgi:hypothetical protein